MKFGFLTVSRAKLSNNTELRIKSVSQAIVLFFLLFFFLSFKCNFVVVIAIPIQKERKKSVVHRFVGGIVKNENIC